MKKLVLSIATVAFLASCGGEEKKDTPANETTQETQVETPAEAPKALETYNVTSHSTSSLTWTGSAVGKAHYGTVKYSGAITVNEGKLVSGDLTFDMKTIDSKDLEGEWKAKLDGHLKSADFFGVEKHPLVNSLC